MGRLTPWVEDRVKWEKNTTGSGVERTLPAVGSDVHREQRGLQRPWGLHRKLLRGKIANTLGHREGKGGEDNKLGDEELQLHNHPDPTCLESPVRHGRPNQPWPTGASPG